MVLYDDKYNFLGMSTETLGFLGYEDINEFISINKDFANLFVQKEGFIYKFDNFSWIDFVLYSGAANKSAIITLKNGQETTIGVSIREIFLTQDIGEMKKLYSVKIISNSYHEISNTPKNNSIKNEKTGGFSLSGLVKSEPIKENKSKNENEKTSIENLINKTEQEPKGGNKSFVLDIAKDGFTDNKEQEQTPKNDFKLNLFKEEIDIETTPAELSAKQDIDPSPDEGFKLNLEKDTQKVSSEKKENLLDFNLLAKESNETQSQQESKESFGFLLKKDEEQTKESPTTTQSPKELKLDFLNLNKEQLDKENLQESEINNENKEIKHKESNFDFLLKKDTDTEETKEPENIKQPAPSEFKLDFLKLEKEPKVQEIQQEKPEISKEVKEEEQQETNFNFLLKKDTQETKEAEKTKEPAPSEFKLDFLNLEKKSQTEEVSQEDESKIQPKQSIEKAKIIKKIKRDIVEIDTVSQDKNTKFILNIPNQPQVEQPLNLELENESENKKEISNFQIKESKDLQSDKSFTNTLKNLFEKNETTVDNQDQALQKDKEPFEFKFNTEEEIKTEPIKNEIDIKPEIQESPSSENLIQKYTQESDEKSFFNTDNSKEEIISKSTPPLNETTAAFPTLSALGLSAEEEFDLIADFIADAKESIYSIEEFTSTNDFDKINYSLVKIKSSAEILNLDAIIEISNNMRKHCISEDSKSVAADTSRLKEQIKLLEKHLEETAV